MASQSLRPIPDAWPFLPEPQPPQPSSPPAIAVVAPPPLIEPEETQPMAFKVKNPENFSPGIRHLSEEESKEIDKLIEAQPISLPEPRQDEWIAHTSNADMIQAPEIPDGIPELGVWGGTIIGALYLLGRVFGFLRSVGITLPQDRKRPDGPRRVVFGKGHSVTCGKCQNEVKV